MQLFPYFGAKEVILVGVDMTSNFRFDGTYNPQNNSSKEDDQIQRINYVIAEEVKLKMRKLSKKSLIFCAAVLPVL